MYPANKRPLNARPRRQDRRARAVIGSTKLLETAESALQGLGSCPSQVDRGLAQNGLVGVSVCARNSTAKGPDGMLGKADCCYVRVWRLGLAEMLDFSRG